MLETRCERVSDLLADEAAYAAAFAHLPEWRRRKCERLSRDADRFRSAAAWLLLDRMLAARGIRAASLSVRENKFGKPEFDPLLGLHFSISHSDGRVMVALSDRPVGCDVERIAPVQAEVLAEGLAPDERTAVEALADGRERDQAFCRLWTRKESYVKACGCGFPCEPKIISTLQDVVRTDFAFQDFEYEDGHMGCVCQRIRSACCAGDGTR